MDREEGVFLVTHEPAQQIEAPKPPFDPVLLRLSSPPPLQFADFGSELGRQCDLIETAQTAN
jgi:hypothetical protein